MWSVCMLSASQCLTVPKIVLGWLSASSPFLGLYLILMCIWLCNGLFYLSDSLFLTPDTLLSKTDCHFSYGLALTIKWSVCITLGGCDPSWAGKSKRPDCICIGGIGCAHEWCNLFFDVGCCSCGHRVLCLFPSLLLSLSFFPTLQRNIQLFLSWQQVCGQIM